MTPHELLTWKQRLAFYALGLAVAASCAVASIYWSDWVISFLPEDRRPFDRQPSWVHGIESALKWAPWIAAIVVIALRFMRRRHIRAISYCLGTLTPITSFIGWVIVVIAFAGLSHRQTFDAQLWRQEAETEVGDDWPLRLCMVDDLISSRKLDGLTEPEVLVLLGPPAEEGFPHGATSCDIHYYLGPDRGFFRMDSEWLFITFDPGGRVNRYWLYSD